MREAFSSSPLAFGYVPGTAPLIAYLHGLGCAGSRDWPPVANSAALRGRASLWIDLLGFGRSARPPGFSYDLLDQARLVTSMLGASPDPVAIVGHSMGGALAVLVAELLVERRRAPSAVLLAEPNLRPEDASTSARVAEMQLDAFVAGWPSWCAGLESPWYRASVLQADPVAFHRSAVSLISHGRGMLERFAALPVARKAYVLGGRSDETTRETARRVAAAGIPIACVERSGHELSADDPAGFAEAIARFVPVEPGAAVRG